MPLISAVVVSYRSAGLAARAIESMRSDVSVSGVALEAVAVVNSGDREEARALEAFADVVVEPGRNLGFAGGLNAGIAASRGEILVLSNPDVRVRAGALGALAEAASSGFVAAGPALFLDEAETIHLPPAEEPHPFDLWRRRLAGAPSVFRRRLARGLRAAAEAARGETRRVSALSGALVAVTRGTLDKVGAFDEAYALYFEENDWQRRLRKAGGRLLRVGGARVVHRYNQSARLEPRAAAWFAESERRYFETHFAARGGRALKALAEARREPSPPLAPLPDGVLHFAAPVAAIALTPLADFGAFALVPRTEAGRWRLPDDVRSGFGGATWYARAVDAATGRVLAEGSLS